MRTPIRIVLGIFVTGIVLACTLFALAQTKSRAVNHYPLINVAPSRANAPINRNWQLGAPVSFQSLTIFPVITDQPESRDDYITLDEGLRSRKVIVSEIGANGRTRRVGHGRRVSDDAEVNRLMVTNRSGKKLILIAGEIIVGGKQDRIVGEDCVIASGNKPVPVDVYCVEHGRWDERSNFGRSRSGGANAGGGDEAVRRSTGAPGGFAAPSTGGMAAPNVRAKAQAEKSQDGVWSEVAKLERKNSVVSSTGTLNRVYEDRKVIAKLGDYERAIKAGLSGKNVVGAVVAIGGQVLSADVFANPRLFQAYWPKLLKSYALEAISSGKGANQAVDRAAAEVFLARVDAPASTEGKKSGYKLTEYQSDRDASFELESVDTGSGKLIHFNRVNKK